MFTNHKKCGNYFDQEFLSNLRSFDELEIATGYFGIATIEKYREELFSLYSSRFDLIFDHKLKIDEIKINEIVKMLELKSEEKLKNLDYRGAIKALRRAEKYISN